MTNLYHSSCIYKPSCLFFLLFTITNCHTFSQFIQILSLNNQLIFATNTHIHKYTNTYHIQNTLQNFFFSPPIQPLFFLLGHMFSTPSFIVYYNPRTFNIHITLLPINQHFDICSIQISNHQPTMHLSIFPHFIPIYPISMQIL